MSDLNTTNNDLSEALLASGRLMDLLDELGCKPKGARGGRMFRGRCPVHGGGDQNLVVGTEGDRLPIFWACHSHRCHKAEKLKPSLLGLVRGGLTGDPDRPASVTEAVAFIKTFLDGDRPSVEARRPAQSAPATPSMTREQVRRRLVVPSPYFLGRGFSAAVLDRFDIGDSPKLNRAVVPVYDTAGRGVGFLSRATATVCDRCSQCHAPADYCGSGEPRWKFGSGFRKGEHLYNFADAMSTRAPFILLVEGVPDVLRAAEAGVVAVSGFGAGLSEQQVILLSMTNKRVVVAFDNDDAGRRAARALLPELRQSGVRGELKHPPLGYKDLGEMPVEAVAHWLAC